jgi:hypothetical protein
MRKDLNLKKIIAGKADGDEAAFRAFLVASFVSLALLTLLAAVAAR